MYLEYCKHVGVVDERGGAVLAGAEKRVVGIGVAARVHRRGEHFQTKLLGELVDWVVVDAVDPLCSHFDNDAAVGVTGNVPPLGVHAPTDAVGGFQQYGADARLAELVRHGQSWWDGEKRRSVAYEQHHTDLRFLSQ